MEEQVQKLVRKVWERRLHLGSSERILIAISGIPGSGKTTIAARITTLLNSLQMAPDVKSCSAVHVSMDGYHFSREHLSRMADPVFAHARRGAAFTFDVEAFLQLVRQLRRKAVTTEDFYAPSFDHALKDPIPRDIVIPQDAQIIIFEGNYLSMSTGTWREVASLMDELWFVEIDFAIARSRLIDRHLRSGIVNDRHEAERRADENDLVNGKEILSNRLEIDEIIVSKDDQAWLVKV